LISVSKAGTCNVNLGETSQTIDGFGFSTAWCGALPAAKNNALYDTLGMSLLRIRIDENSNWGDETNNAAAAHRAGAKVLGTPWSPPPAWNSNGKNSGGYLLPAHYGDYANWLKKAGDSIGLDFVSIQNEPDFNAWVDWNPTQIFDFVKNNGPTIGKPLVMPESFHFNDEYSDLVINDTTAESHFTYLGGHLYGGGLTVHENAIKHNKHVWMTEHYFTNTADSMPNCMQIAKEISDCLNDQMSAYYWWWVNDNMKDGTNLANNQGQIFKNGYTIGQFAKWIRPGYVRVSTTYSPTGNIYVTAFKNGGSVVIVAVNTGTNSVNQEFSLQNGSGGNSFNVHRTSASDNMAAVGNVGVNNNSFTDELPGQSVTNFHP